MLARGTRGVPRLLNQAGHQALALAFDLSAEIVDAEVALEVLSSLGLHEDDAEEIPLEAPAAANRVAVSAGATSVEAGAGATAKQTPAGKRPDAEPNGAEHDVLAYRLYDPPRQPA
jgi:hypothetical protein